MTRRQACLAGLLLLVVSATPCHAGGIAARWKSPSRLTVAEAAFVLYRHASGRTVPASDFFEAEKYLRTDGGVSLGEYVLTEVLARLLADHLGAAEIRARALPPVLHWMDFNETAHGVRVRGESVQVAVLNSPPLLAATVLYHRTIDQDWRTCSGEICWQDAPSGARTNLAYALSVPSDATLLGEAAASRLLRTVRFGGKAEGTRELAAGSARSASPCDPEPSEIADGRGSSESRTVVRHAAKKVLPAAPNLISCAFVTLPTLLTSRFSYTVDGVLAAPPARAARSAVTNNPLDFLLVE